MRRQLHALEACPFQDSSYAAGIGPRKLSRRFRLWSGLRRQKIAQGRQRPCRPWVLRSLTEDRKTEPPVRLHRAVQASKGRGGIGEEHDPEARECEIESMRLKVRR